MQYKYINGHTNDDPYNHRILEKQKPKPASFKINIKHKKCGFGDHVMYAIVANNIKLCYPDIDVCVQMPTNIGSVFDINTSVDMDNNIRSIKLGYKINDINILLQLIESFNFQCDTNVKLIDPYPPVVHRVDNSIPHVNIVICSKCGRYCKSRQWIYYDELKDMLDDSGISYIDINKNNIFSNDCLEYVRKCDVYLGLETGTSHYVSGFAANKGIIIQSGFNTYDNWGKFYDYDFIYDNIDCSPCGKRSCPTFRECMTNIKPDTVFNSIMRKINA